MSREQAGAGPAGGRCLFWLKRNWFLVGLVLSVGLAFLLPGQGAAGGILRTEITTKLAVAVIFFLRGILLPLEELRRGILAWRLHLLVHAHIFLLFPLSVLILVELAGLVVPVDPNLRLGFLFLAALPTTISTAVVFTAMAGGNSAASVFNSTLSNCLGVFLVPLWIAWLLQREAVAVPLGFVVGQIVLLIVVPLVIGQAIKPLLWEFSAAHRKGMEAFSSGLVLFIMFAAFANSVAAGAWHGFGGDLLAGTVAATLVLFVVATAGALAAGRFFRLEAADRISLAFCGPQKTLAAGAPIANILFPGDPALTLILLPVLFYHFIQLFAGGYLIERLKLRGAVDR
jgi:solute carrier family 10 (sodium/bile acid cotransporter), member 7